MSRNLTGVMSERRFPVAGTELTIPWAVAEQAYAVWKSNFEKAHPNHIPAWIEYWEGQGGFTESELDAWAPGWREEAG